MFCTVIQSCFLAAHVILTEYSTITWLLHHDHPPHLDRHCTVYLVVKYQALVFPSKKMVFCDARRMLKALWYHSYHTSNWLDVYNSKFTTKAWWDEGVWWDLQKWFIQQGVQTNKCSIFKLPGFISVSIVCVDSEPGKVLNFSKSLPSTISKLHLCYHPVAQILLYSPSHFWIYVPERMAWVFLTTEIGQPAHLEDEDMPIVWSGEGAVPDLSWIQQWQVLPLQLEAKAICPTCVEVYTHPPSQQCPWDASWSHCQVRA